MTQILSGLRRVSYLLGLKLALGERWFRLVEKARMGVPVPDESIHVFVLYAIATVID